MGYLEANPNFKLSYWRGGTSWFDRFANSNWGNSVSLQTTTSLLARYNMCIVQWRSKLQKTISLSIAEAEYYAASKMAIKVIYLCNLLENMGFPQDPDTPVYEDNTACIKWGNHVIEGRERAKPTNHCKLRPQDHPEPPDVSDQSRQIQTAGRHFQSFHKCSSLCAFKESSRTVLLAYTLAQPLQALRT
jgi:hypothetical protein